MAWKLNWPVVSAVASILALPLTILLFVMDRDMKELTVETVASTLLFDLDHPGLSAYKLTYNDTPVTRASGAIIEFRNTGTLPVEGADFELPIRLHFENAGDLLSVILVEKSPQDLNPVITSDAMGISISPLLLNRGDWFRILVQIAGEFKEPEVEARISGISKIARSIRPSTPFRPFGIMQLSMGIVTSCIYLYFGAYSVFVLSRHRQFAAVTFRGAIILLIGLGTGGGALTAFGGAWLGLTFTRTVSLLAIPAIAAITLGIFAAHRSQRI